MPEPDERVIDTMVLQKANAPITNQPRERSRFMLRLKLLQKVQSRAIRVLISRQLLAEYNRQITVPRNDFIKAFFELLSSPDVPVWNWKTPWSGQMRNQAARCRFPKEDTHVLRTAIRDHPTHIISEEDRMLAADPCIYRHFSVHIQDLE
jgi:hypothetical protein